MSNAFIVPPSTAIIDEKRLLSYITSTTNSVLLPDLLSIVVGYAAEVVYRWLSPDNGWPNHQSVTIDGNKATSKTDPMFRVRIRTAQTLSAGPRRWRILIERDPSVVDNFDAFGIGITRDPSDYRDLLLLSSYINRGVVAVWLADILKPTGIYKLSFGRRTIITVEVDVTNRTITTGFQDIQSVVRNLTGQLPPDATSWRPFIDMVGSFSATILSWPDD